MATQTDDTQTNVQLSKEAAGAASWAGIVGGGKGEKQEEQGKPQEQQVTTPEAGAKVSVGESGGGTQAGDELDPSELKEFTEIRSKKDKSKKKEYGRGGRRERRGRKDFDYEGRGDKGEGRGGGWGKRGGGGVGADRGAKDQQGTSVRSPQGQQSEPETEHLSEDGKDPELEEEKVQYVPAPAPVVNPWKKPEKEG
ncbi:unnamed protein product, partial [Meganyctiphanes norvegica]